MEEAGVDTGCAPEGQALRAPDIAFGDVPDAPGWVCENLDAVRDEGKAEATAAAVLRVLEARRLPPSAEHRRRITEATDPSLVERWLGRAVTEPTVAAVLAD